MLDGGAAAIGAGPGSGADPPPENDGSVLAQPASDVSAAAAVNTRAAPRNEPSMTISDIDAPL
ncbi:hypothetical protein CCR97_05080 [Rhodoplanes elegans]|uniref:Uncharacterized protein n=1 Tax=Rhodoplanes elegans TaxID=29408 RepID=A0A327KT86_9BRAD|nr:hypothetical protein [Rhodoplanes elegans]RAI38598.1 hypothetical protein CH338_12165 [Rhodoplanes elegans]